MSMKQHEAVALALERLGGEATLGELYRATMEIPDCHWGTKTPFASIRRIVQTHPAFVRVRPGLWALKQSRQERGLPPVQDEALATPEQIAENHSFYQGLLLKLGSLGGYDTFAPHQDRNRLFVRQPIGVLRTLSDLPPFTYPEIVKKASTVDVIWFVRRSQDVRMPASFIEVEHTTDFVNSLVKFCEFQDFSAAMVIVAARERRREFEAALDRTAFEPISKRVEFVPYDVLAREYEAAEGRAACGLPPPRSPRRTSRF